MSRSAGGASTARRPRARPRRGWRVALAIVALTLPPLACGDTGEGGVAGGSDTPTPSAPAAPPAAPRAAPRAAHPDADWIAGDPALALAGVDSLLLITLDTTRADRLGAYGRDAADTPHLDALAASGVLFERCIAVAPITLPSHASILTGLYPFRHGARSNITHHLEPGALTLPEILSAQGLATGAVVSSLVLDRRYGLDQGFGTYDDDLSGAREGGYGFFRETDAEDTARRALAQLDALADGPGFTWVHFFDPHGGYEPPEPWASRFAASPYEGELAYVDRSVGALVEGLRARGRLERTLVAVTADHGESLGEHGEAAHSLFIYDATTRVPLILSHPALPAGRRVSGVTSGVDLAPTALELLGLPRPPGLDGVSLAAAVTGDGAVPPDRRVYSESMMPYYGYGWSDLRAMTDAAGRYVRAPRPEYYDLATDPDEGDDLYASRRGDAADYARDLERLLSDGERDTAATGVDELPDELATAMAQLGYVGGPGGGDRLDDPKDFVGLDAQSDLAAQALRAGDLAKAEAVARNALAVAPGHHEIATTLVNALVAQQRLAEAVAQLEQMVAAPAPDVLDLISLADLRRRIGAGDWRAPLLTARRLAPRDPRPWTFEGHWSLQAGDPAAALALYDQARTIDEDDPSAWLGVGRARAGLGDLDGAQQALVRAVGLDPLNGEASLALGTVRQASGDLPGAVQAFEQARERTPGDPAVLVSLAAARQAQGDTADAESLYREALRLKPDDVVALVNLGSLRLQAGEADGAADLLARACDVDPTQLVAWSLRLQACSLAQRDAEVVTCADHLLAVRPQAGWAATAAASHERLGEHGRALARLRQALAADPQAVSALASRDPVLARLLIELE